MYKNLRGALSALLLYGLLLPASHAEGGLVLYGALTSGGDTLARAYYEDGDDITLKAGGLFHFAIGYQNLFDEGGLRVTWGWKFDTLNADNGDADMSRFPLEVALYRTFDERHNLGGGLVYEMSPEFSIDTGGSASVDFDDATGFMLFYGYNLGTFEWGVRFTDIEYEADGFVPIDGGSFGIYGTSFFD